MQKGSEGIQAAHRGTDWSGLLFGGWREAGGKPKASGDGLSPGPWCLDTSHLLPRPSEVLRNPPRPSLTFAPPLSLVPRPLPSSPAGCSPRQAGFFFLPSLQGWPSGFLPARSSAPQLGPPPTTCHPPTWNPLCPGWRPPWQALCPEALCYAAAGGLGSGARARDLLWFLGGV